MKIIIPYKLRRALALGAIAGGALVACNKGNTTSDTPTRDVELEFGPFNIENIEINNIKRYADMLDVRYIYMIPEKERDWITNGAHNIKILRSNLEQRITVNPQKVRGKGNFCFKPGEASKVPQDSLWFIQNGWTIKSR